MISVIQLICSISNNVFISCSPLTKIRERKQLHSDRHSMLIISGFTCFNTYVTVWLNMQIV